MPNRGRRHDHRQGNEPAVQVRQNHCQEGHADNGPAAPFVLPLTDPKREEDEREREQVRPDQE